MVSLTTQELTSTGHLGWNSTKTQAYVLCASIVCALFMPKESQSYVPCRSIVCSLFVPAPRTGSGAGGRSAPPRGKPVVSHTTGFSRPKKGKSTKGKRRKRQKRRRRQGFHAKRAVSEAFSRHFTRNERVPEVQRYPPARRPAPKNRGAPRSPVLEPKEGQIPGPGNPLVFSVRARKKGPAGDKIARFSPFGADGPVNKSNSQF